ncbi:conserved membrane hypothetical protein [Desulfovibrionales bacterium]
MNLQSLNAFLSPEKSFLIAGVLVGLCMFLVNPPFMAPDEHDHFDRAYQLTLLQVLPKSTDRLIIDGLDQAGAILPLSLADIVYRTGISNIWFNFEHKLSVKQILNIFQIPLKPEKTEFIPFDANGYPPGSYLFASAGILIGRLLSLPPLALFYIGRLCNLTAWLGFMYLAVRLTPLGKWTFVLLALMPTSVFVAASISADAMTNAFSFLLTALFLHTAFSSEKNITLWKFLAIVTTGIGLSYCKIGYVFLILLAILIPKDKHIAGLDNRVLFIGLFLICLSLTVLWVYQARSAVSTYWAEIARQHMALWKQNPLLMLQAINTTIWVRGGLFARTVIGVLGWLDAPIPIWTIIVYWGVLIFATVNEPAKDIVLLWHHKTMLAIPVILSFLLLAVLMFFKHYDPSSGVIEGLQGRYLIPLLPSLLLMFPRRMIMKNLNYQPLPFLAWIFATHIVTLVVLVNRYFLY